MEEKRINKCLKSYLIAKKYYNSDTDKSFEYFKQCIKILNEMKENNIKVDDQLASIIEETETECSKYLTNSIEIFGIIILISIILRIVHSYFY